MTSEVHLSRSGMVGIRAGVGHLPTLDGYIDEGDGSERQVFDASGPLTQSLAGEFYVSDGVSLTATARRSPIDWENVDGSSGSGRVDEFALGLRGYWVHPYWRQWVEPFCGLDILALQFDTGSRSEYGGGVAISFGGMGWLSRTITFEMQFRASLSSTGRGADKLDHDSFGFEAGLTYWFGAD